MSQSLSKVYVRIIFSTKNRQPQIDDNIKTSLFEYSGGICKGLDCNPLKVGGHLDHIRDICMLSRKKSQIELPEELKKQSSKWIKTKGKAYASFYWQDGYGIFSVNHSETDVVIKYISNQEEHHKKITLKMN